MTRGRNDQSSSTKKSKTEPTRIDSRSYGGTRERE